MNAQTRNQKPVASGRISGLALLISLLLSTSCISNVERGTRNAESGSGALPAAIAIQPPLPQLAPVQTSARAVLPAPISKTEPEAVIDAPSFVRSFTWAYTGTATADLRSRLEESTNLVNWNVVGITYCASITTTSANLNAFYRVASFEN